MSRMHSLRIRLIVAMLVISVGPVVLVSVLLNRATTNAFTSYATDRAVSDAQSVAEQVGQVTGKGVVVVDGTDKVIGDSTFSVVGSEWDSANLSVVALEPEPTTLEPVDMTIVNDTKPIPAIEYVIDMPPSSDGTFLDQISQSLWITLVVSTVFSVIGALMLARQIVRPVEKLTEASHTIANGDLDLRVNAGSRDEIGTLARAFNRMIERREQVETLRRNLVSDVAHELRTPLTNLTGYLELLGDHVADPSPELVRTLQDEARHLNRLVDDLQELALAEAGQLPIHPAPVSLDVPVGRAIEGLRAHAEERDVRLVVAPGLSRLVVNADTDRVVQIVRNLVHNAIQHSESGETVEVVAECDGGWVAVSVNDAGSGIPVEHLPHIFDRFYRVDASRSRNTGGVGLGLAIVRNLVTAHGGVVSASRRPHAGTSIQFSLPLITSSS